MGLQSAFIEGGWVMWPTLALGAFALALALRHAVTPRAQHVPLIVGLGVGTLLAGTLGVVAGVMATLGHAAASAEPGLLMMVGVRESLHNAGLSLALATFVAIATGIGSYRGAAPAASPGA